MNYIVLILFILSFYSKSIEIFGYMSECDRIECLDGSQCLLNGENSLGYECSCSGSDSNCSPSLSRFSCEGFWRRIEISDSMCYLRIPTVGYNEGIEKCHNLGGWPMYEDREKYLDIEMFYRLTNQIPSNTWIVGVPRKHYINGTLVYEIADDFNTTCPFKDLGNARDRSNWQKPIKLKNCNETNSMICNKFAIDSNVHTNVKFCSRFWAYSPYFNECIRYFPNPKTYDSAKKQCRQVNSKLASFLSKSHYETLKSAAFLHENKQSCKVNSVCEGKRSYKGVECACDRSLSDEECKKFLYRGECRTKNCLSQWYRCLSDACPSDKICIDIQKGLDVKCIDPVLKDKRVRIDQPCTNTSCASDELCYPIDKLKFKCIKKPKELNKKLECLICNSRIGLEDCVKNAIKVQGCASCRTLVKMRKDKFRYIRLTCSEEPCKEFFTCENSRCIKKEFCCRSPSCQVPNYCSNNSYDPPDCRKKCACNCDSYSGACLGSCAKSFGSLSLRHNKTNFMLNETYYGENDSLPFFCTKQPNYDVPRIFIKKIGPSSIRNLNLRCKFPPGYEPFIREIVWIGNDRVISMEDSFTTILTNEVLDEVSRDERAQTTRFDKLEGKYRCIVVLPSIKLYSKFIKVKLEVIKMTLKIEISKTGLFPAKRYLIEQKIAHLIKKMFNGDFDLESQLEAKDENNKTITIVTYKVYIPEKKSKLSAKKYSQQSLPIITMEKIRQTLTYLKEFVTKKLPLRSIHFYLDICPVKRIFSNEYKKKVLFTAAKINKYSHSKEKCFDGKSLGKVKCMLVNGTTEWDNHILWRSMDDCYPTNLISETSNELKNLSTVIGKNPEEVSEKLENITTEKALDSNDVFFISTIIDNIKSEDKLPNERVFKNLFKTTRNLFRVKKNVIDKTRNTSFSLPSILNNVEKVAKRLHMTGKNKRFFTDEISIDIKQGKKFNFNSFVIKNLDKNGNLDNNSIEYNWLNERETLNNSVAAIHFEDCLISSEEERLITKIISKTDIFEGNSKQKPISKVISASLSTRELTDIDPPITIVFLPMENETVANASNIKCVFWDEDSNKWSTDGCFLDKIENKRIFCKCDHFTNFAVLLDVQRNDENDFKSFSIITIIGLWLSIVGLSLIILSCLLFTRNWRNIEQGQVVLFNLALALIIVDVTFLLGINRTENITRCYFVSATLYYSLLAAFGWMLVEGILAYLNFVPVFDPHLSHLVKITIACWVVPAVPVMCIWFINRDLLIGYENICWLAEKPFYYGFILPISIILLINLIIFIMSFCTICKSKIKGLPRELQRKRNLQTFKLFTAIMFVTGLTWIFGFLAINEARQVFQAIFCIFNAFQGAVLFLFYITRRRRSTRRVS